jgi:hypothetical protein
MRAQLKLSNGGYGSEPQPTGEIEVLDSDTFKWRDAKPEELVPALVFLVCELWKWKQRVRQ